VSDERAIDQILGIINEQAIDLFLVIKAQAWVQPITDKHVILSRRGFSVTAR
jgi:hypothetical protein